MGTVQSLTFYVSKACWLKKVDIPLPELSGLDIFVYEK